MILDGIKAKLKKRALKGELRVFIRELDFKLHMTYLLLVLVSSRSASTETLLLVFLVTLALLLTLATRGRPPCP